MKFYTLAFSLLLTNIFAQNYDPETGEIIEKDQDRPANEKSIGSLPLSLNEFDFDEIYNEVNEKLKIKDKAVFIDHAKGYLNLGEISIIIAVATKHREEAYKISRYIIEEIKKRSPIWKKEHYQNSESNWLKGNPIIHENN